MIVVTPRGYTPGAAVLAAAQTRRRKVTRRRWRPWRANRWLQEVVLGVLMGFFLGAVVFAVGALVEGIRRL